MTLILIIAWLMLLISYLALFSRPAKRPPSVHDQFSLGFITGAVEFLTDPVHFIQEATRKCGNVFSFRILSFHNVWLRGNTLNKHFLHTREDVWSFTGGMAIFLDRLVDIGYWNNYKVLLASISRYTNRSAAQKYATLVTVEETKKMASAWAASREEFQLFEASSRLVHRIIVRAMMGEDFYRHHKDELLELLHTMEAEIGNPLNFVLPIWAPHPAARRLEKARLRMKAIFSERLLERESMDSASRNRLQDYIAFTLQDKPTAPLKDLMPSHHTLLLFAAHTSTAANIAWNIVSLLRHPDIMARVTREARDPESTEHPLLQACIKETSRFYCGVRLLRLARQDVQLPESGHHIPRGSFVSISPYLTHHDPENFANPEEWLPERWLGQDGDDSGGCGVGRGTYMPFGGGSHRCVGEKLARIMVAETLVTLLRAWDVDWADEGVPRRTDFRGLNFDKVGSPWLKGDVGVRIRLA